MYWTNPLLFWLRCWNTANIIVASPCLQATIHRMKRESEPQILVNGIKSLSPLTKRCSSRSSLPPTTLTSKHCCEWHATLLNCAVSNMITEMSVARRSPIWSRGRHPRKFANYSTSSMTSPLKRKRKTSAPNRFIQYSQIFLISRQIKKENVSIHCGVIPFLVLTPCTGMGRGSLNFFSALWVFDVL